MGLDVTYILPYIPCQRQPFAAKTFLKIIKKIVKKKN